MDVYMQVVTERMKDLSEKLSSASQQVEENCSSALRSLKELRGVFAFTSRWSITSTQQRIQDHLATGRKALEQAIQEYENANADLITIIEKGGVKSVTIQAGNKKVEYAVTYEDMQKVLKEVDGVRQIKRERVDAPPIGRCETVSLATLIRRRMTLDGKNPDALGYSISEADYVDRKDFFTTGGGVNNSKIPQAVNTILTHNKNNTPTTDSKNAVYDGYTLKSSEARTTGEIVNLLQEHPEGIQVAVQGKMNHKIVISDYSIKDDGSYQFYCYDGVDGTERLKLEETWTWTDKNKGWAKTKKGVDEFFAELEYVRYLE